MLSTGSQGGEVEREILSSLKYPVIGHIEMIQRWARRGLDLTSGSISL